MNKETQEPMTKERLADLRELYRRYRTRPLNKDDRATMLADSTPELLNEIERLNKVVEQAVKLGRMNVGTIEECAKGINR